MPVVHLMMSRWVPIVLGMAWGLFPVLQDTGALAAQESAHLGTSETAIWDTAQVWTDFEAALQRPEQVWRLDLSRSKWKEVDHRLRRFRYLREIVLDKNKIDSLPPWIGEFEHLERLSIKANRLTRFSTALLDLSNLRELNLADNMIDGIPEDIDALAKLERLILWSNVIGHFPPSLSRLEYLEELDLLHNEMSTDEQIWVRELLPGRRLQFSPPCQCQFDD